MLSQIVRNFNLVQKGSFLKKYIAQSTFCKQKLKLSSFCDIMEKAIDEREENLNVKKEERHKANKERYDGRVKRRVWENKPESEEAKKQRIEEFGEERIKRRKCVILLGYSGVNYSGMQRNPDTSTIEEELMKAMLKVKWINEMAFETPQQVQFQRAARTDKGVSACRQVVSIKIPEKVDIDEINDILPSDIRVFAVKRVTKGFNSKSNCDARTYSYTLPTYAFAKKDEVYDEKSFRLSSERLEELNKILNLYEGTKNYHNFTIRKEPSDPSCRRYIIKVECKQPYIPDGTEVEFSKIIIKGQSFMMHQIRRMVGLVIAIMKGFAEPYLIAHAMQKEKFNVPQAPGLGLVLEKVHYERYNKKYAEDGVHESLEFKDEDAVAEEFYMRNIMSTIIETELKERSMQSWIKGLLHHSFSAEAAENNEEDGGNTSD
ncbi:hypothetical protein PVAND_010155 [Polypedilum vanderplanki]|uniref:Pseudouridylate synthase 1 homolog n=1 Tax=Polypedilum vanderplanki TaxID=319348 RepID=A0A9J6CFE0_POLVA|nr:hypothetical protein PVAND_010155 [Polypedilum vanderplanki]